VIWGRDQCRVYAAHWHDGQISRDEENHVKLCAGRIVAARGKRKRVCIRLPRDEAIQDILVARLDCVADARDDGGGATCSY
jgi:hypothetical protein